MVFEGSERTWALAFQQSVVTMRLLEARVVGGGLAGRPRGREPTKPGPIVEHMCSRRDPLPRGVSAPKPRAFGRRSRPGRGFHVASGRAAG